MKKLLLISLLVETITLIVSGQNEKPITKGNFLTGGSFSFDTEKTKDYQPITGTLPRWIYITDTKTFDTDFYFGYFMLNNFAVGLKTELLITGVNRSANLDPGPSKYRYHNLSFGPLIRYYNKTGIFIEGSAAIGLLKTDFADDIIKWENYSLSTGIGYSLFITKSIAIEPEIKYKYLNRPTYEIEDSKEISSGLNFSIGFQIYINPKTQDSQNN